MIWLSTASAAPPAREHLFYALAQTVTGEDGVYEGYHATLVSSGRYEFGPLGAGVRAEYDWRFGDSEGKTDSGRVERTVLFDPDTRRYTGPIDLDDPELERQPPEELATWFWVPPEDPDGPIRVLDVECDMATTDQVPVRGPFPARVVTCTGTDHRTDDYGDMDYTFTERYWYDAVTGLVLAEELDERATGTLDGRRGGFRRHQTLTVTQSSFAPTVNPPPPPEVLVVAGGLAALGAGTVALTAFGALACLVVGIGVVVALRPSPPADQLEVTGVGPVRIRPLTDVLDLAGLELVGLDGAGGATRFAPFVEDLAARAVAAGDPAWLAVSGQRLVGFAWLDRAAGVGTVLTSHPALAENFVRRGLGTAFFSEVRHLKPDGKPRWNVQEAWTVLELLLPARVAYDAALVRPFTDADRPAVDALLEAVWGTKLSGWLTLQLARGDLAFVAAEHDQVIGFALAAVSGKSARLTLASVAPDRRDRGVGTELVRARLAALSRLGVEQVVVEVADWNVAMLHVLQGQGFVKVGSMVLQTAASEPARRALVRR